MLSIIKYSLIENFRSKIYLSSLFLLMAISFVSWLGSILNYNFGELYITIFAFGMNLTDILVLAITLFLPVNKLSLEYERGTAWVIWSKLNCRSKYYLGKYFAYLLLTSSIVAVSAIFISLAAYLSGASLTHSLCMLYFILFSILKISCILSLVFLFYAFFYSSILPPLFTLLFIYFSIFLDTAKEIADTSPSFVIKVWYAITYYVFPQLSFFNVENQIIYKVPISSQFIATSFLYALIFSGVCLSISSIILKKKDL